MRPAAPLDDVYPGSLDIDGVISTSEVLVMFVDQGQAVLFQDGKPSLPGFTHWELHLKPFNTHMLRASDSTQMAAGIRHIIEGTNLGVVLRGPLGNPADGEYDTRLVRRFDVLATFTPTELSVHIEGATYTGRSGWGEGTSALPPIAFNLTLTVPLRRMDRFFKLAPQHVADFEKLVKACR